MKILVSREDANYWQKKGALAFRFQFGNESKDGIIIERNGQHTCFIALGEKEKPARNDSQAKRGDSGGMTRRKLILLARRVVFEALRKKYTNIVLDFRQFRFPAIKITDGELAELLAINFLMASFEFRDFLSKPKEGFPKVNTITLVNASGKEIQSGIERGIIIGEEVNHARHIATMPGGNMTPAILAKHTKQSVKGLPIQFSVLNETQMARLKMGGVLAVGQGSQEKSRFIILEYFGAGKPAQGGSASSGKEKPICPCGQGRDI